MRAIIEALEYIRSVENVHEICVEVFCDRQDVVYSAIGKYQRKSNKEEWRRFDRASKDMDLTVTHIPRNSIPEQELTDSISGQIREKLEQNPGLSPIHYSNTKP